MIKKKPMRKRNGSRNNFREKFILKLYYNGFFHDGRFSKKDIKRASKGKPPKGYNVHHIVPRRQGGTNSFDNLTLIRITTHEAINEYESNTGENFPQNIPKMCIFAHCGQEHTR
jgi:hypothetical protein